MLTALKSRNSTVSRVFLVGWLALALYSCSATGASQTPDTEDAESLALQLSRSTCAVSAYARDPEPGTLALRAEPNAEAETIKQLPSEAAIELSVTIAVAQDEWVRVDRAVSEDERLEFSGQGWLPANQLALRTKGYDTDGVPLYDSASEDGRAIAKLPADYPVTLVSCDRDWVKIETETQQGWLAPADQCANPYTTCS